MYAKILYHACALLLISCGLLACKKDQEKEPIVEENADWLLSGRLIREASKQGQILALSTTGERYQTIIREDNSFTLMLPADESFAVYFLPSLPFAGTAEKENNFDTSQTALLSFHGDSETGVTDILRLPKNSSYKSLDLGTIAIKGEYAYPSTNPANKLDFDNDGIPDLQDHDDDNDGHTDTQNNVLMERISVCHEHEKTISIALSQLLSHLEHEDSIGDCEQEQLDIGTEHAQNRDKIAPPSLDQLGVKDEQNIVDVQEEMN